MIMRPVIYETHANSGVVTNTTKSFNLTVGNADATRTLVLGLSFSVNSVSGIDVTVGGSSAGPS